MTPPPPGPVCTGASTVAGRPATGRPETGPAPGSAAGLATRPTPRTAPHSMPRTATRTAPRPTPRSAKGAANGTANGGTATTTTAAPHAAYPSFTSYVRARGPVLLRTARSLTANPSDAEDLLQTALAKTFVAWERIEDHRALDGYVRRALLNTRTSQWRKRKVDEFACEELPEPTGVAESDPAERQVLHDAMWRAVMKLPDRQRAMVVLRYYEDLSEAQTAEVLGVSVGTVKSAVSRALGKLREDPELSPVR